MRITMDREERFFVRHELWGLITDGGSRSCWMVGYIFRLGKSMLRTIPSVVQTNSGRLPLAAYMCIDLEGTAAARIAKEKAKLRVGLSHVVKKVLTSKFVRGRWQIIATILSQQPHNFPSFSPPSLAHFGAWTLARTSISRSETLSYRPHPHPRASSFSRAQLPRGKFSHEFLPTNNSKRLTPRGNLIDNWPVRDITISHSTRKILYKLILACVFIYFYFFIRNDEEQRAKNFKKFIKNMNFSSLLRSRKKNHRRSEKLF